MTRTLLALLLVAATAFAWSQEAVDRARGIPVQDGGRIKPLDTLARFTLLRLHGRQSIDGRDATEWMLDVLFDEEKACAEDLFLIQNDEVLEAVGLHVSGKRKRDRYSFDALRPAAPRIDQLAREYSGIPEKDRSSVEQQIVLLAHNLHEFNQLRTQMDHARAALPLPEALRPLFEGRERVPFSTFLDRGPQVRAAFERARGTDEARAREIDAFLVKVDDLVTHTNAVVMFPPVSQSGEAWLTPHELFRMSLGGGVARPHLAILQGLEGFARSGDPQSIGLARAASERLAAARAEYEHVELEVAYYKWDPLQWSLAAFLAAFLSIAVVWMRPSGKWFYRIAAGSAVAGTVLVTTAIVMRCIIRERPPVSTLYETVLFVTATGAIVALVIEAINRRRIALSAAAFVGVVGLFVASGYLTLDKKDTMPSLQAVLDTNFWLATHVTCITLGYSAGMLAALLASIYLIAKAFGAGSGTFFRELGRMVYGVVCFALFFSLVGTILGGIWANDSWGRFWGWDPKENGALLICISQIAILHGRMAGWLRPLGTAIAAAFGGTIIAFSWWGVNLLGVGLHSYGFTSGINQALWIYYGAQWGICGLGIYAWWRDRARPADRHEPVPARDQRNEPVEV